MRRITFWVLSTISTLVLLFGYHTSTAGSLPSSPSSAYVAGTTPGAASTAGSGSSGSTTSGGSGSSGIGSSGGTSSATTVTGDVASTQWGPVQVQLTVDGGRITKAQVLQYPNGNSQDAQINGYALPILLKETVAAQSAGIDMISGATITSTGYVQSLQSALDKAGL
jgi:hypothetical protein